MPLPDICWREPFGLYHQAVKDSAESCPEFHFMSLLSVIGSLLGRSVSTWYTKPLLPNFFVALVGESERTKKSTAIRYAQEVFNSLCENRAKTIMGISSAEGLIRALGNYVSPDEEDDSEIVFEGIPSLMVLEELAALLRKARQESISNMPVMITTLYDCPPKVEIPTRRKPLKLTNPHLSILAGTTPEWLEDALTEEEVMGGFANRFLYCVGPTTGKDIPRPPKPDLSQVEHILEGILNYWKNRGSDLGWSAPADNLWAEFYLSWKESRRKLTGMKVTASSRIPEYGMKAALIYAALDKSSQIEREHVEAAIAFSKFCWEQVEFIFSHFSLDVRLRREGRILNILEREPNKRLSRSELHKTLSGRVSAEDLNRSLNALIEGELVSLDFDKVWWVKLVAANRTKPARAGIP